MPPTVMQPRLTSRHPTSRRVTDLDWTVLTAAGAVALLAALVASGCARYQVGNGGLYPQHIRTVYVPVFESASYRRNLGERLTEAVAKQIEMRTPYIVVGTPDADSILSGRIINETKRVLVENAYDEPRQLEVNLQVEVNWLDRHGQFLRDSGAVPIPATLVNVGQSATLVPEVGQSIATGHQEAIDKLAMQIVALMETPW